MRRAALRRDGGYDAPMARFEIRVRSRFEAAHHLTAYRGSPEPVHGHSWKVEACVVCEELNDEGYGVDFVALKAALDELAGRFDGGDVNRVPPFDTLSPTAEHLARWFHEELSSRLVDVALSAVTIWEAPGCSVTYRA